MSDIKSIGHQNIHSTQSAPPEGSQKKIEIEKEYKPAEFRPLSSEQKESIKLTRNAENKMAEEAIKAKTVPQFHSISRAEDVHVGLHLHKQDKAEESDIIKANTSGSDPLPIETGPLGKLPEFPELDRQLPMGTGPTGELPDLDDLKYGLKKVDKYLKPVTDVIREKIKGDS